MLFRSNLIEPGFIKAMKPDKSIPDKDSFFWRAFEGNISIAENALNTSFMQGIKNGNLPPDVYGSFTVLDSYYCYNSACSFRMAYTNAQNKGITALASTLLYLTGRYEKYNEMFLKVWHIADSKNVVPTDLWKGYAAHERRVAQEEHPIYILAAMLPCYHLWYWLSDRLISYTDNNIYGDWIKGCHYPDGAYLLGSLIEDWKESGNSFDDVKAMDIYRTSMEYEYKNFADVIINRQSILF